MRHRLLDIKVAITRTSLFIAVYSLVLGIPFAVAAIGREKLIALIGGHWLMLPLGLMAVLATAGPFIYIYVQSRAEARLLRAQRRYQETLKQASQGMTRIRDLARLLQLIAHIVTRTVRISHVAIYIFDPEKERYMLRVGRDHHRVTFVDHFVVDDPLVRRLKSTGIPLIYEEIRQVMQNRSEENLGVIERHLRILAASVVVPSFLEDRLIGFIVLGEKISKQMYTVEDIDVFQVLANQAALAIENAQFYEDTKMLQSQIAQAEKMATVGTMADGLSHQINNRFYALSLIAGDTIDTIRTIDPSQCTLEVQEMLKAINHALERIQVNVMQGAEVVKGILKYTRKGETGFEALELDELIRGTLEMVQYKVKLSELDLERDFEYNLPRIHGNQAQLQEVFFNFLGNAYDAIMERRTELKEPEYRGKIAVRARAVDTMVEIELEDNGIGIRETLFKKIFTPFFTTKTSSRRGTGLGLYVIHKIITEEHKGSIRFDSQYGKGTRFVVRLPAVSS